VKLHRFVAVNVLNPPTIHYGLSILRSTAAAVRINR